MCVWVYVRTLTRVHLSVAAILACLFDQPIKALSRGQIARTSTLSLLRSLWVLPSSSQTFTVVNTIWNTPPCVGASFRSPGGYEEHCAASSALSRSGEYISFTLSVCLFVLESSVVLKVNVQSYITKVTVSLCKVIANIYTCWTAALLGNLKPSHSEK